MFRGDDAAAYARVAAAAKLVRYGADCYAYGLLAHGLIDLVVEASLKPYDFSAMAADHRGRRRDRQRLAGQPP